MLALIVGNGALPGHLVTAAPQPHLIARIENTDPTVATDLTFRLTHIASFLADLKTRGVTQVCFAGGIHRPNLDPDQVEPASAPYIARLLQALRMGDNGAFTTLLTIFEEAGLAIQAAQDIAPDLLPKAGSETHLKPTRDDAEQIIRARSILTAMGSADIGQALVIHRDQPIAIEAAFGTDWMLASLKTRPDGAGGLLYKAPKPGQDRRIDLPTIGPGTIEGAAAAGLTGVVIDEGGVIVLNRPETLRTADAKGLFLWVRKP